MSKNLSLINSADDEEHTCPLVQVCPKAQACELWTPIIHDSNNKLPWYFFSITIPPDTMISVRGKKKPFKACSADQQYYYYSHLLTNFDFEQIDYLLVNIEQNRIGCIHFHAIVQCETVQLFKSHIMQCLKLDYKKFDDKININYRLIHDHHLIISYFMKEPLLGIDNGIDHEYRDWNDSIIAKQYEKTKYKWFVLESFYKSKFT